MVGAMIYLKIKKILESSAEHHFPNFVIRSLKSLRLSDK